MKKENKYISKDISILELDDNIDSLLKANEIKTVNDLWLKTKKELKSCGLNDKDIKYVSIKLQLIGLDLNKKMY